MVHVAAMAACKRLASFCGSFSLWRSTHWQRCIPGRPVNRLYSTVGATTESDASNTSQTDNDVTSSVILSKDNRVCHSPQEAQTNLLTFLNKSDIQKRQSTATIPFFTAGSYLSVTRADPASPTGVSKFVGICIARRNKGLGSTFILRNVMNGIGVEMMYELYSPALKEIKVLKLERRRRAKLYYLRDKPLKYSTVSEKMEPVDTKGEVLVYRRRGAPA